VGGILSFMAQFFNDTVVRDEALFLLHVARLPAAHLAAVLAPQPQRDPAAASSGAPCLLTRRVLF
jgi:hypothetical protein